MTDIDKESRPSIGTDRAFEAAAKALHQNWTPAGVHALIDAADAFCARFAAPAVQAVGEPGNMLSFDDLDICAVQNAVRNLEYIEEGCYPSRDHDLDGGFVTANIGHAKKLARAVLPRLREFQFALKRLDRNTPSIQPPPSAKPAPADPRPVVGIVDERYLRPTNGGEG